MIEISWWELAYIIYGCMAFGGCLGICIMGIINWGVR